MEITLTDDQEFFRDTTRKFLETECPIVKVRELAGSPDGFERDYWRQGAELGWVSLLVPEEHGGGSISGSGVVDLTLVADAFGSHAAPGPLLPANVVAAALARSGTDEQRSGVLPAVIAGEVVATWAIGEPVPHDRLGDITVRATADGGDYVLSGVKSPVEAGAQSEQLLVTARTDDGLAQFLVPAETSGVTVTSLDSIDLVRRYASIEFDGVRVSASAAVGSPGTRPWTSNASSSSRSSCRRPRWSAPRRRSSTSRSTGCSAVTRSAGPSPHTRTSSIASRT